MLSYIHLSFIVWSVHVKAVSAIPSNLLVLDCKFNTWTSPRWLGIYHTCALRCCIGAIPISKSWSHANLNQFLLFLTNPMSVMYLGYVLIFMHQSAVLRLNCGLTMCRVLSLQLSYSLYLLLYRNVVNAENGYFGSLGLKGTICSGAQKCWC